MLILQTKNIKTIILNHTKVFVPLRFMLLRRQFVEKKNYICGNFPKTFLMTFRTHEHKILKTKNLWTGEQIIKPFFNQDFIKGYLNIKLQRENFFNNIQQFQKVSVSGLTLFSMAEILQAKNNPEIVKGMLTLVFKQVVAQYKVSSIKVLDLVENGVKKSLEEIEQIHLSKIFLDFLVSEKKIAACQKAIFTALTTQYKFPKSMVKQLIEKHFPINLQALPQNLDGTSLREIYAISLILEPLNNITENVEAFMINPNNILATPEFSVEQSNVTVGQSYADLMLKIKNFILNSFTIKLYDEKSSSNKPNGRIVILFYFLKSPKNVKEFIHNVKGLLTKSFKEKKILRDVLNAYKRKLNDIEQLSDKDLPNKLKTLFDLFFAMLIDPALKEINFSLYALAKVDQDFTTVITPEVLVMLEEISQNLTETEIEELFPRTPYVRIGFWDDLIKKLIRNSGLKHRDISDMLDNYNRMLIEFYGND